MKRIVIAGIAALCLVQLSAAAALGDSTRAREGKRAYDDGNHQRALGLFNDLVRDDPEQARNWYNRGAARYKLGQYADAAEDFEMAAQLDPGVFEHRYNLGNAYVHTGDYEAAVREYERALESRPGDADAKHNLEYVKRLMQEQAERRAFRSPAGDDGVRDGGEDEGGAGPGPETGPHEPKPGSGPESELEHKERFGDGIDPEKAEQMLKENAMRQQGVDRRYRGLLPHATPRGYPGGELGLKLEALPGYDTHDY